MLVARHGHLETIRYIIEIGYADENKRTNDGLIVLYVVNYGQVKVYLAGKGALIEKPLH